MISLNLSEAGFIAIRPNMKRPLVEIEEDWNNHILTYEQANKELENGNNIAIVGGINGFVVIDDDSGEDKLINAFNNLMQPTYCEQSITGGKHLIYKADNWNPSKEDNFAKKGLGEFRCFRMYCLIAPSKAKDEKKGINDVRPYEVLTDNPVCLIDREDLNKIKELFGVQTVQDKPRDNSRSGEELSYLCKLVLRGKTQEQCFEEMKLFTKWNESSQSYRDLTYQKAVDFCFSILQKRASEKTTNPEEIEKQEIETWEDSFYYDKDLKDYVRPSEEYLIDGLIPKGHIGIIVGNPQERKTFLMLYLSLCGASGKSVFGIMNVPRKLKIFIIDEENGKPEIDKRIKSLKEGMKLGQENLEIAYLSFFNAKLDQPSKQKRIISFIEQFKPDLVFVDCLQRVLGIDIDKENQKLSEFLTGFVRPVVSKYGCSWVFLHHYRKRDQKSKYFNPMDEIRGATELRNIARFAIGLQRPHGQNDSNIDQIILKQIKMSNASAAPDKVISFTTENNSLIVKYEGLAEEVLNTEQLCAAAIKTWLFEEGIKAEFKTGDVEDAQPGGYKKTAISGGLKVLLDNRFLEKIKRGIWKIKIKEEPKTLEDFSAEEVKQ